MCSPFKNKLEILKDVETFERALKVNKTVLNDDYDQYFTIFEQICKTAGTSQYIKLCGKYGIDMDKANSYQKYPIHFVAESCDVDNFRALLTISEVTLNYKCDGKTAILSLCNNIKNNNFARIFECIKYLLNFEKIDINLCDNHQNTPIYALLKNRSARIEEIIEYVTKRISNIELESFRNGEAYELMSMKYPQYLEHIIVKEDCLTADQLYAMLDNRDERKFLLNINKYVMVDDEDKDIKLNKLLHTTIKCNMVEAFKTLLSLRGEHIINIKYSLHTPIGIACQYGRWEMIRKLLEYPDIELTSEEPLLIKIVKELDEDSQYADSGSPDYLKCFNTLIGDERINVNDMDRYRCTALHYAVINRHKYCTLELLKKLSYIGTTNVIKRIPVDYIDHKILWEYFDGCIHGARVNQLNFQFHIDYRCLSPKNGVINEMEPILKLAKSDNKSIILHPFLALFVFLKWSDLRKLFYLNVIIHFFFCFSIMLIVYLRDAIDGMMPLMYIISSLFSLVILLQRIMYDILTFSKEKLSFVYVLRKFWKWLYTLQLLIVVTTQSNENLRSTLIFLVTFLTIIQFVMTEFGALPLYTISTYTAMFRVVVWNLLRCITLNLMIFIIFGLMLMVLDSPHKDSHVLKSITRVFTMFRGELDASDFNFELGWISYVIFVVLIFVLLISFNLLNGLAVNDIKEIKSEALLTDLIEQVKLLSKTEDIVNSFRYFGIKKLCPQRYISDYKICIDDNSTHIIMKATLNDNSPSWSSLGFSNQTDDQSFQLEISNPNVLMFIKTMRNDSLKQSRTSKTISTNDLEAILEVVRMYKCIRNPENQ